MFKRSTTGTALLALILTSICSPATFAQPVPPPPPPTGGPQFPEGNHWQCYRAGGPLAMQPVPITVGDQFGKANIVLGQPIMVCNPSTKSHKGKQYGVTNPQIHLVCYNIVKQLPPVTRQVKTRNQFGDHSLITGLRTMFCAPSYKKVISGDVHDREIQNGDVPID